jgi:hypothetical protein
MEDLGLNRSRGRFFTANKVVCRTGPPGWKSIPGLLAKNLQIWAQSYKYIQSRRQKPKKSRETCSLLTGSYRRCKEFRKSRVLTKFFVIQRQKVRTLVKRRKSASKIKDESIEYDKNNCTQEELSGLNIRILYSVQYCDFYFPATSRKLSKDCRQIYSFASLLNLQMYFAR